MRSASAHARAASSAADHGPSCGPSTATSSAASEPRTGVSGCPPAATASRPTANAARAVSCAAASSPSCTSQGRCFSTRARVRASLPVTAQKTTLSAMIARFAGLSLASR
ncbi:hypothetical protein MhomT_05480 [Microbacterium hominis]|nr:hypothetical protein MhomT_05480 [Microbacterium hominis]